MRPRGRGCIWSRRSKGAARLSPLAALAILAFCATLLYLEHRLHPLFERLVTAREPRAPVKAPVVVPNDLVLAAGKWGSEWAKADALKAMSELYEQTGSWDSVRHLYSQHPSVEQEETL